MTGGGKQWPEIFICNPSYWFEQAKCCETCKTGTCFLKILLIECAYWVPCLERGGAEVEFSLKLGVIKSNRNCRDSPLVCLVGILPGEGRWLIRVVSTHNLSACRASLAWRGKACTCVYSMNARIHRSELSRILGSWQIPDHYYIQQLRHGNIHQSCHHYLESVLWLNCMQFIYYLEIWGNIVPILAHIQRPPPLMSYQDRYIICRQIMTINTMKGKGSLI